MNEDRGFCIFPKCIKKRREKRITAAKHALFERQAYTSILQSKLEASEAARRKQANFLAEERKQKYDLIDKIGTIRNTAYKKFANKLKQEVLNDRGYDILQEGTIDRVLNSLVEEGEK